MPLGGRQNSYAHVKLLWKCSMSSSLQRFIHGKSEPVVAFMAIAIEFFLAIILMTHK